MISKLPRNSIDRIRWLLVVPVSGLLLATVLPAVAQEASENLPYIPTVLITGANRGLGLEFTRQYVDRGWRVIATARRPDAADDLNALAEKHPGLERVFFTLERAASGSNLDCKRLTD